MRTGRYCGNEENFVEDLSGRTLRYLKKPPRDSVAQDREMGSSPSVKGLLNDYPINVCVRSECWFKKCPFRSCVYTRSRAHFENIGRQSLA